MSTDSTTAKILELIEAAEINLANAKSLLGFERSTAPLQPMDLSVKKSGLADPFSNEDGDKIIEGVFDGQLMIDSQDNEFPVPANYASKSKLIPGDILKLTITKDGTFLYK